MPDDFQTTCNSGGTTVSSSSSPSLQTQTLLKHFIFQITLLSSKATRTPHRYILRPTMSADQLCCCGCGDRPEPGRKAHICTSTGRPLFAGFCQSSEDCGPCRRCFGSSNYKVCEESMLCHYQLRTFKGLRRMRCLHLGRRYFFRM